MDEFWNNIEESFTLGTASFKKNTIMSKNFDFTVKSTVKPGIYTIYVNSLTDNGNINSNAFEFVIEPKPVEEVAFVDDSYVVGIGSTKQTNSLVMPAHAYNQNVIYSVKDPNIATVDENGIITGISEGETYLYINSADGTRLQASTKIQVVPKSIDLSNVVYEPNVTYQNKEKKLYDKDSGSVIFDVELVNIDSSNLKYELYNLTENNNINVFENIYHIVLSEDHGVNKLRLLIRSNDLTAGDYQLKVISDDSIIGIGEFEILKYNSVKSVDVKYEGNSLTSINIVKGDKITLEGIVDELATDITVEWCYSGDPIISTPFYWSQIENTNKVEVEAYKVGKGALTVLANGGTFIYKEIKINVVDPKDNFGNVIEQSNMKNISSIDERYGGTFTNVVTFDSVKENTKVDIELYDSNDGLVDSDKYTINDGQDILITNSKATINISYGGEYRLSPGTYKVKY